MAAIFPLALLGVAVVLVALMPCHHPHPNHLFFLDLLSGQPTPSTSKAFADDCAELCAGLHDTARSSSPAAQTVAALSMAWVRTSWGRTVASGRAFLISLVMGGVSSMM
jgi:hypothetical protein